MIDAPPETAAHLRILQLNVNKSYIAQQILINSLEDNYDVVVLQEPWIDALDNTRTSTHWTVYYPSTKPIEGHNPIRTVTLVNTKIPTNSIQQLELPSSDTTVIKIT